ncbi:peptidylprolyl isomerase [Dyadobacter psychrotolerans]|uniref:Peptidylprolyl isomerase n=1 Tax=Dyadobacter psychrotolerans TaxID=2541721 RepID=A0A4V2Z4V9_9BACT|nr:peptidylprolyl isomerase [Dyadobacter psychrotolerans]TDE18248.1 peptidylprolyl isomerase [Dyadobacter psychrotolerans]
MFKRISIFCLLLTCIFTSCRKPASTQKTVTAEAPALVEIGNEKFSQADFLDSYEKNKAASDSSRSLTPEEYLNLYTDVKIKVMQAKKEGRDTTSDYKEEINSYYNQLAKNFLVDKALVEKLANEAYNRMKQEVRASHILIAVPEDASPADTLEAYRAAIALRGRLEEGADFGEMAERFSKDPSAVKNKGDLGYFTSFQTIYPFENAAYSLPVGKISNPVRSKTGYHIIKVIDRRASRGMVRVAHIMIQVDSTSTPVQKELAKSKIDEAYAKLQAGNDWDNVVETYSTDSQSRKNQGLLPMFGTGQMVPEIEEAAFNLNKTGNYSKPVLTIYGWHIVKLVEKKSIEPYAAMASSLRQKVVTDSRGKVIDETNAQRLRKKYTVTESPEAWKIISALADSSILTAKWDYARAVSADWSTTVLFNIEQRPYYALEFLNALKSQQKVKLKGSSPTVVFRRYYQDYLTSKLSAYEKEHLEESSPEFRSLINEIREGVLLSQVMEEHVWQKSLSDSLGQKAFYEKNKTQFSFPERAKASLIMAPDTQTINSIKKTLAQRPYRLERKGSELLFAEGISDLNQQQTEEMFDLFAIMQRNPDYLVEVAGYRSAQEPESTSASRIKNVIKYLNSKNISIVRIIEKDYGSFRPSMEPARNRRIAFQFYSNSRKDVEKVYNSETPESVMIQEGYFTKENPLLSKVKWEAGEQMITNNGKATWIRVEAIEPPRLKTFMEARGSVINAYQKELEKQWLSGLHQKFPVKVNDQELEKIKR